MEYRTKEDYVAEYLREGIISGRFERGARLKQAEVADALGLSITPVREALKLLEAEGYLTRESHHGVTVAQFDRDASTDVLGLRVLLEERLVRAAVIHMTDAALDELQEIEANFERAVAAGDRTSTRGINYRLHTHLYAQAQLPQSLHFVQVLWAKYPFDVINFVKGRTERAVQEHRALLRYVAAREGDKAAQAIRRHIEEGWREIQGPFAPVEKPGAKAVSRKTAQPKAAPLKKSPRSGGAARKLQQQKLRSGTRR
jgi:DNA-binding GntR family transcriptional regulator